MKTFLTLALVCILASTANAAIFGIRAGTVVTSDGEILVEGSMHPESDPLTLAVSTSAEIQITLDMYDYSFAGTPYSGLPVFAEAVDLFVDTVEMAPNPEGYNPPIADPTAGHENFEILDVTRAGDSDFVWLTRSFTSGMTVLADGPLAAGSGLDAELYALNATKYPSLPGFTNPTTGSLIPNRFILDTIVIHCTEVSTDTLWFENGYTFQAPSSPSARLPLIYPDGGSTTTLGLTNKLGGEAWGLMGFDNGFIGQPAGPATFFEREGFWIVQTPEPASFAVLALGGLALLRRRK